MLILLIIVALLNFKWVAVFYLGLQWSPEQIAQKVAVSHESVYLRVYADKAAGGNLHKNLRSQKPRRKRYLHGRDRRGQIPNRRPISERPSHMQVGHWEGDTVIGAAHKQAIVTLVERKSGYAVLAKVSNKTADLVGQAIEDKLGPLAARVKTLTVDNGKEFANHQAIDQALGIQTYFADPYCSWQRGSNENFNGLLRQYIPKKRRMETVTDEELAMIQNRLNHRPRKRLGFKTPHEVSRLVKPCCTSHLNPPNNTQRISRKNQQKYGDRHPRCQGKFHCLA